MPQTADKVLDHEMLFREPEYQKLFADKKTQFEFNRWCTQPDCSPHFPNLSASPTYINCPPKCRLLRAVGMTG